MERNRMSKTWAFGGREGRTSNAFMMGRNSKLGSLRLDLGFVHEHHRDIVFDGIHAPALRALKALSVRRELDRRFAERTYENVQKFLADSHFRASSPSRAI